MLPESDVRAMVRLLADVAVVNSGIMDQKRRLMEGIAALSGSDHWMWNVGRFVEGGPPVAVSLLHNLTEKQLALLAEDSYNRPNNPYNQAFIQMSLKHRHWTRRLEDMLDLNSLPDADNFYRYREGVDMAQSLFTVYRVPGHADMYSAVGLHRSFGRKPYTRREMRIAHVLISEVGWLHEHGVPGEDGRQVEQMSPRLQIVLSLLIDGQTSKRIAHHLGLSDHTVRGYIKQIYKHFQVGSRTELLRRFMVGDGQDSPT